MLHILWLILKFILIILGILLGLLLLAVLLVLFCPVRYKASAVKAEVGWKQTEGNGQVLSDSKENLYSYDGHGNLVNGKDNSSTTVYDAYGNKTEDIGIGDAPFGYCGEYTDSESGFVYLRNRYYDPSTGSFITEDPVKDGNNWYGYCAGNPVNGWDPSGLFGENTILQMS